MNITKNEYIENPCHTLSIPYWKNKIMKIPPTIHIIHKNDYNSDTYKHMNIERYFRLSHPLTSIQNVIIKEDMILETIDLSQDMDELIHMINSSYEHLNISVNKDDVLSWLEGPVYHPLLWIALKKDNRIIGSGIADYDPDIQEGILEWIQVIPEYWHQGLGQIIVNSLIARLAQVAKFVTVTGSLENETNPEALYRKCGFEGDDIWYICREII